MSPHFTFLFLVKILMLENIVRANFVFFSCSIFSLYFTDKIIGIFLPHFVSLLYDSQPSSTFISLKWTRMQNFFRYFRTCEKFNQPEKFQQFKNADVFVNITLRKYCYLLFHLSGLTRIGDKQKFFFQFSHFFRLG